MNLEFRTYQPGDEAGLAETFNRAFQMNGGGFLRTSKSILYRYVNRPHGKPEEIQVAYDKDAQKVVGCVFATAERFIFGGKLYYVGSINDVSTLPEYTGQGIARKLMLQSIAFMEQENCDFSSLTADPNGYARKKMYLPMGWRDYQKEKSYVNLMSARSLIKHIPIAILVGPAIFFKEVFYRMRIQHLAKQLQEKGISCQIFHPNKKMGYNFKNIREIYHFIERVGHQNQDGKIEVDEEEWQYWRERPFIKGLLPSYVAIKKDGKLIGAAYFLRQFIYVSSYGMRFPIATLREYLVDHHCGLSNALVNDIYTLLGGLISIAAAQRDCPIMTMELTQNFRIEGRGLKSAGFFSIPTGVYMLRQMKEDLPLPLITKKPIVINPCDSVLYP